MIFRIKEYLKFLLKSTNQHGVHSPFVYNLVTKCFYDKKKRDAYLQIKTDLKKQTSRSGISLKKAKLLNRIVYYFDYKTALVIAKSRDLISNILSSDNLIKIDYSIKNNSYDLIYIDLDQMENKDIKTLLAKTHNDSLVIVNSIYASNQTLLKWEMIKKKRNVKVTINTYKFGMIFFRKEQAKEHFLIRV